MVSDNEVIFRTPPGQDTAYNLISAVFTVLDFKVSPGEATTLQKGYVSSFNASNSKGSFHFKVDRHKTGDTAKWFNDNIQKYENTFDDVADELNFAIMGTLRLCVSGGRYGENTELVWNNACFAQGHNKAGDNNWWFGVQGGKYAGGSTNRLFAPGASGTPTLVFQRGGKTPDGKHDNDHMTVWVYLE